ncbi:hypothetical protein I2456_11390 [Mycobacterium kubicae]|uniref:ESX-1 secretion-associated protein n=2 Tax=Mycobacterium kubicae TaxID=120959 RepID=A0AAX1JJJ9_9MYCO|nr:hypothetical protein [Mycobacterium kubicae]MCV7095522.1 hypothetical protein [Mycobacterium kubicae]QNI14752.1 hypothetical protein GAN18_11535 [Mycobacterium kubicae]QPI40672.1 hypothetical protein I2456_11390 [Mycobacterium kubicae]
MSGRWDGLAGELKQVATPACSGLSCQASAVAVSAAHADVAAFRAALVGRMRARASQVAEADAGYVANEAGSAGNLAAVVV